MSVLSRSKTNPSFRFWSMRVRTRFFSLSTNQCVIIRKNYKTLLLNILQNHHKWLLDDTCANLHHQCTTWITNKKSTFWQLIQRLFNTYAWKQEEIMATGTFSSVGFTFMSPYIITWIFNRTWIKIDLRIPSAGDRKGRRFFSSITMYPTSSLTNTSSPSCFNQIHFPLQSSHW